MMKDPVRWSLSIYTRKPTPLPLLDSDSDLPHAIVFVPGLTDTLGTCPYLERLAHGVKPFGFSVVQLQLSSSLGGFGVCSLEGDAQEMSMAVKFLRGQGKDKVILMGHSTGCQNAMSYLSHPDGPSARGEDAMIDAAVLQAPVSDREAWENENSEGAQNDDEEDSEESDDSSEGEEEDEPQRLQLATQMVKDGRGAELLPRKGPHPPKKPEPGSSSQPAKGNVGAVTQGPMSAYRWWSLCGKGGDDDYFSIDLGADNIRRIWRQAGSGLRTGSTGYILALVGGDDETIARPKIQPQDIVSAWKTAVGDEAVRARFEILKGANHKVDPLESQIMLVAKIRQLIKDLGCTADSPVQAPDAAADRTATGASTRRARPPPSLPKGIPAWQLAEDSATSQPAASPASVAPTADAVAPHPPSFDALVELIASGRADEIEGIRDIPLKINDETPSQSHLENPKKPWER